MSTITAEVREISDTQVAVYPLDGKWKASVFHLPPHPQLTLEEGQLVNIIVHTGGQFVDWAPVG
jgi:hypothetical protein